MAQIKHSILIQAPAERIHPLVASANGFTQWWAADVTETDGVVELGFFKRATIFRLQPTRIDPPREAQWLCMSGHEWQDTKLLFNLAVGQPGQTLLHFTHADWREETEYFVSCTTTWGELMFRIKAAAEGKALGPLFSATGMGY